MENDDSCNPEADLPLVEIQRAESQKHVKGRKWHATSIGPIPWLTTAYAINAPLMISCWKHGDDLPSIEANQCVFLVEDVCYNAADGERGWNHQKMHEKLGVSADPEKPWVCFGDSNHRFSEITHAGITICLKVANLWQIMYDGVRSVNTHGVVRNDANRCSVANLPDEIVRINNPITKWSFFKEESTGANNNNNNKKKITEKNKESRRLRKDRSRRPKDDYVPSGQSESGDTPDSDS